jgi:hypothetical protein
VSLRLKQACTCKSKRCSHCSSSISLSYKDVANKEILVREVPQCSGWLYAMDEAVEFSALNT